jgi:hypothetical protein
LARAIECTQKKFTGLLERIDALFLHHRPAELKFFHNGAPGIGHGWVPSELPENNIESQAADIVICLMN